jgi:dsDNA-binding SOS-regulon protein
MKVEIAEMRRYIKLRSSFLHIQDETAKRRIFAAIRRLSSALDGAYAADKLLDAVAGLEGLLVASNTEVSHKFAERVALFLAQGTDERTKLCKKMKDAYRLRSKVAHGGVIADDLYMLLGSEQPSKKQIDEFNSVNKLSGLCMQYLYEAISLCITKGTVDFDWENSVMSGGPVK